ncbi:DUF1330 domain-containing protein [Caulobacter sp. SLTY]|uniref:DUF1330 domain-containing protein n=1 Tax=Caulobacter sp. SLTY TaxID=2683262 RepID=UPI001412E421|nr:DUF1330 domain-containing protein [Caulobacter sp. SLTY]NBB16551.1 DUF1330 domain-containing protein [Caulobacter sp. SLTY]
MTVYAVFVRDRINDPQEMATYGQKAAGAAAGHNLTPLAFYGATETLEGEPVDGAVLISFPTMEEAKAWYNSPAYQEALPHRLKGADYRVFLVQGL